MMNGSANGSSRAKSSTLAMRTMSHVEEMQLAAASLELAVRLELEQPRDQSLPRVKDERVQHPGGPGPLCRGVLGERELKERVELNALATASRVLEQHAAGGDVAGAAKAGVEVGRGR